MLILVLFKVFIVECNKMEMICIEKILGICYTLTVNEEVIL